MQDIHIRTYGQCRATGMAKDSLGSRAKYKNDREILDRESPTRQEQGFDVALREESSCTDPLEDI